jgi:predicted ArsR family transcriptional regulator
VEKLGPRPSRADRRAQLSEPRRAVLDQLVEQDEPLTVTRVARTLGQHPNTVREHLEALTRAGLARRDHLPPAGRGRPASVYTYAPEASFTSPEYAVLARVLVSYLTRTVPDGPVLRDHALEAGRSWGRAIVERDLGPAGDRTTDGTGGHAGGGGAPAGEGATPAARVPSARVRRDAVDRLAAMLDRAGFDSGTRHDGAVSTVRLGRCPVLELARERPEVVCNAHLGMAREILSSSGVEPGQVSLAAFVEPGACLLHVGADAGASGLRVGLA